MPGKEENLLVSKAHRITSRMEKSVASSNTESPIPKVFLFLQNHTAGVVKISKKILTATTDKTSISNLKAFLQQSKSIFSSQDEGNSTNKF